MIMVHGGKDEDSRKKVGRQSDNDDCDEDGDWDTDNSYKVDGDDKDYSDDYDNKNDRKE